MATTRAELTRRGFLKGAALTAAGGMLAGGALSGCAPQASAPSGKEGQAAEATVDDAVSVRQAPARLNPQDPDYRANTTDLATVFSSVKIGSLELSNRIVKSAAGSDTQNNDDEIVEYYRSFAKGGVELVWVEDCADKYEHFPNSARAPWARCPSSASRTPCTRKGPTWGTRSRAWASCFSGTQKDSSGQFASAVAGDMTLDEIRLLIADAAAAAKTLQDCGFDAVEINAAGNNIGQSFFSRNEEPSRR